MVHEVDPTEVFYSPNWENYEGLEERHEDFNDFISKSLAVFPLTSTSSNSHHSSNSHIPYIIWRDVWNLATKKTMEVAQRHEPILSAP